MIYFSKNLWNEKAGDFKPGFLEIDKGRFKAILPGAPQGVQAKKKILDLGNLFVAPSGVDLHIHSRDFKESYKETFESLEAQMQKGGVSAGVCMANTIPRLDSVKQIDEFVRRVSKLRVELKAFAAVSQNLEGRVATDFESLLKRSSVVGLSDDGKPVLDVQLMKAALKATKKFKKFISLHEEDTQISQKSLLHPSPVAVRLGLSGSPAAAEYSMVERDLDLLREVGGHLHFGHLSAKESVSMIRSARKKGLSVSAELTPHHGLLSVDDCARFDWTERSLFKVCPVIRSTEDRAALWQGLKDGTLDCLASDHAPHSSLEKDTTYELASHGIISMEYYFSLYHEIRLRSQCSWKRFFHACSYRPAELMGLQKPWQVGSPANFIAFSPAEKQTLQFGLSRSSNSPLRGEVVRGKIYGHFIKGERVYAA